jgi:hypothetical protein
MMDIEAWLATSPRRLNRLAGALGCKTYLEIGVSKGVTFQAVNVETKTGVDPDFQFDWQAEHDGAHTRLLPLTSDAFFAQEPIGSQFDLIFLDGLHTYDQTYRDLQNALLHSHPGTVILIDDTIPCDVYSCGRDQEEAIQLRAQSTGVANAMWHGDTYKIMPLIHLFHTAYHYCTIIDQGNPQTILWRSKQPREVDELASMATFWGLENLAACDYLWMLRNPHLFNPLSEMEGLERAISGTLALDS